MRSLKPINCISCNVLFYTRFKKVKFCSRICADREIFKLSRKDVTCAWCKTSFVLSLSRVAKSKSGLHFCSRICKNKAQRINGGIREFLPKHYGAGLSVYQRRAKEFYGNKCQECGIEDTYNGKPIVLDVHHIDGNRKNGAIENLKVVCPNCHRQEEMMKWDKRKK